MSSADWLAKGDFTQQDVDEALLSVFQSVSIYFSVELNMM